MYLDRFEPPTSTARPTGGGAPVIDRAARQEDGWVVVCPAARIAPDTGVAAWLAGEQVAVFRLADGDVHAVDNRDPASGANVLARGIVGDSGSRPVVASPLYKQRFDLITGACLDDPSLQIRTWDVQVVAGQVALRARGGTTT